MAPTWPKLWPNPLKYARGLAAAAAKAGAVIRGSSAVTRFERKSGRWHLHMARGQADGDHVLIVTNGYTGFLIPGLRQVLVLVFSSIVARELLKPSRPVDHDVPIGAL